VVAPFCLLRCPIAAVFLRVTQRDKPAARIGITAAEEWLSLWYESEVPRRIELARDVAQFNFLAVDLVILSGDCERACFVLHMPALLTDRWRKRARDGEFNCGKKKLRCDRRVGTGYLLDRFFGSQACSFLFLRSTSEIAADVALAESCSCRAFWSGSEWEPRETSLRTL